MNIGILGTGGVAQTLATKFLSLGHAVKLGGRAANGSDKAAEWLAQTASPQASTGTFADAALFGELLIMATSGIGTLEAAAQAGAEKLAGKVVVDLTNPLDFSHGMPPRLFIDTNTDSLAEQLARAVPKARFVKALNTVNAAQMVNPASVGADPDMLIAGDDDAAKQALTSLLRELGWQSIIDLGPLSAARLLEAYVPLWVAVSQRIGTWEHAAKFLHR